MKERIIVKEFEMNSLNGRAKKIRIILPNNYDLSDKRYPVLYMHDGQNLVDPSPLSGYSWEVMKTMDQLAGEYGDMIIVGMDSHPLKRILEYTPVLSRSVVRFLKNTVGVPTDEITPEANEYGTFIIKQVKSYIDQHFRTITDRLHTFIAGSSCGGIISLYLGLKYQNVFSVIGAFSPAYWFVHKPFYNLIETFDVTERIVFYHDMGTSENETSQAYLRDFVKYNNLMKKKIPETNIIMFLDEEAKHNEFFWAKRFQKFYALCFTI